MAIKEEPFKKSKKFDNDVFVSDQINSLVVHQRVLRADVHELMMSDGGSQSSKTRVRNTLQDPPESLVPDPAHIEADSPVQSPASQDQKTAVGTFRRISFSPGVSLVCSLMGKVFYSWPLYDAKKFSICKVYILIDIVSSTAENSQRRNVPEIF